MKKDATKLFKRCENNPLIKPQDYPGIGQLFNPGVAQMDGETVLLVSGMKFKRESGKPAGATTFVARSKDGINFTLGEEDFVKGPVGINFADKFCNFQDNRISKIDDTYYIVTPATASGFMSPCAMLGKTKDFKSYEPMSVIAAAPNNGACLFPGKINGKYYKLDRPGDGAGSRVDIWISESTDLVYWGGQRSVIAPDWSYWNCPVISPAAPVKTEKGWLVMINGTTSTAGGTTTYIGAVLLDIDEPWKVIGKTASYLLRPEADYEKHGRCDNKVFACGAIADEEKDELRLYYGGADECVCLATAKLSEVIDACIEEI